MITSVQNNLIVETFKLKDKKHRKLLRKYIIEGEKMVREALQLNLGFDVIFSTKEHTFLNGQNVCLVSDAVMKKLSDTMTPQGILGVAPIPNFELNDYKRCVVLDQIQDSGNLGSIIRTMAAVGIDTLFLHNCADVYSPKTIRSSMSGIYYVKCFELEKADIIQEIQNRKIPLVLADMQGEDVFQTTLQSFALVVGNEAHGISEDLKKAANKTVSLKMKQIESLNAAVAASVILYKLMN